MNRRDFFKTTAKQSVAYSLLATTMLGSHAAMAGRRSSGAAVTEDEIADLEYMREEEKLARDVYLTMYQSWGLGIFDTIAESEQTHTDAVKAKIEKYGLDDPVADDIVGVFVNPDLQLLYNALVEQGNRSPEDALFVGCAIEEIDMIDLQQAIDHAQRRDIARIYQSLMRGSENHLRAFVGQIEKRGMVYTPRYISPETADQILGTYTG